MHAGLAVGIGGGFGFHFDTITTQTVVTTVDDKSHVGFSLADEDGGDFFVVQIYR